MITEQRLTDRLTKYWDVLKKDKEFPPFQRFNSAAIDDIWGNCILLMVDRAAHNRADVTFYRVGDKIKELYNSDLTGHTVNSKQRFDKGAAIVQRVDEVLKNPQPINDNGQFINNKSKIIKFRSCLLPFGIDGKVTHVVVGLSWREFG